MFRKPLFLREIEIAVPKARRTIVFPGFQAVFGPLDVPENGRRGSPEIAATRYSATTYRRQAIRGIVSPNRWGRLTREKLARPRDDSRKSLPANGLRRHRPPNPGTENGRKLRHHQKEL